MEEDFKKVIENIKEDTVNEEETKRYILAIKRVVKKAYETCKDEQTEEEILQDYLEEYDNDLKFRGEAKEIFNKTIMYESYKSILSEYKGNKSNFDSIFREARKRENQKNTDIIFAKKETREAMISAVRYIIRSKNLTKEKDILSAINIEKTKISNELRSRMVKIIHSSLMILNEYGFIDEYIEEANKELEQIGLSELKYVKRNPIADRQYDENGQLVEDVEDIGVLDAFFEENLEQMSIEDLEIVTTFWESKYLQERVGLSKAMSTIKTLDLWKTMIHEDDEAIENLEKEKIRGALKKDLALTYLCRENSEITGKMKKQYKKFLKDQNMESEVDISEEIEKFLPEISNLESAAADISILECLIIHQMLNKNMKVKKWGIVEGDIGKDEEAFEGKVIAIENRNFRGPLLMGISEGILIALKEIGMDKIPTYDKELNDPYCNVMANLYMPTNRYFNNLIKKAYKENPNSKLLADLAGKKVRTVEER